MIKQEHPAVVLVLIVFTAKLTSTLAATQSLQYFYTGVTSGTSLPEFTLVGLLDGEQIVYYDSNIQKMIPKTEWMKKVQSDDPQSWNRNTRWAENRQEDLKNCLAQAKDLYNHTEGVHTVQWMYGYDNGTKKVYALYAYDGEEFFSLYLSGSTWTTSPPKADSTKQMMDTIKDVGLVKDCLQNECPDHLKTYEKYGSSSLERKVPPEVDLFQKNSSSPVVCHATGFFPKEVMISWQKNGVDLEEDVELRETLPNQDGTFQKRSILTVTPEEMNGNEYTCVIQHAGLKEELLLSEIRVLSVLPKIHVGLKEKLSEFRVLSGEGSVGLIIGVVVVVLLLFVIGCVGVFVWKKKSGFKPVSQTASEGDSSSNNSK